MTLRELYNKARQQLSDAGVSSYNFDALCLLKKYLGADRIRLAVEGNHPVPEADRQAFEEAVALRAAGHPLQYILKEWELCGTTFQVGDGVLIPRQETEILVETAVKALEGKASPFVVDLCGGSGCVAICIAKIRPDAKIISIELSDAAFWYLVQNIDLLEAKNVTAVKGDILQGSNSFINRPIDLIVSNPPYIPSKSIRTLQREVGFEPRMALDGGTDGLKFYRAIADLWIPLLNRGGKLAVEIGMGQEDDVIRIFRKAGLYGIEKLPDLSDIYRVVTGTA